LGIFPAKNWSETGSFLPAKEIGLEAQEQLRIRSNHCFGCPVGCSQIKLSKNLPYAGTTGEPEFETLYSFGGQTGVDNPDSIITADRLCDELGMDTISAGVTIGFAMELFEKGIIGLEETKGLNLKFGNHEDMIQLLKAMAYRQGIGSILADGVKKATQELGKQTELYAIHIKGLELPGYDVRGALAHGLNYATAYTGADHNRGYAFQEIFGIPIPWEADRLSPEKKGELTVWNQDIRTATCDCPTICAFMFDMALAGNATEITATLLNAVTGLGFNAQDIAKVGERVNNLARSFNVREGFSRADDILPERLMNEHIQDGNSKGCIFNKETLDKMLDEYYSARGWDIESGIPTMEKLISLNLEYVSDQLKI
jgi:aldehyde:ferredoxin oxidoreductase